ncbi:hypothetical protein PROFUN_12331 [Planoprotostelium fungivorum]|uniref:Uncharacterized protein n=1 Tax=Planoprotostelium fungivorum TaxID=1890364 RepID=A0A2P6N9F6_9EUKA|nr:hypothetical protein PROFUN_12331 [Planoprotostelium fungivorum]
MHLPFASLLHIASTERANAYKCFAEDYQTEHRRQAFRFCNFYCGFIQNYSSIVTPMTNMTRKDVEWKWTPLLQKSFEDLKEAFVTADAFYPSDTKTVYIRHEGADATDEEGSEDHDDDYVFKGKTDLQLSEGDEVDTAIMIVQLKKAMMKETGEVDVDSLSQCQTLAACCLSMYPVVGVLTDTENWAFYWMGLQNILNYHCGVWSPHKNQTVQ